MIDENYTLSEVAPDTALWLNPSARDRYLSERLAELENFIAEDRDWIALGAYGQEQELSRQGLAVIGHMARLMAIGNPLIFRGVNVKANYVWGRGVSIHAKEKAINALVQAFLDDRFNQVEFTSQPARVQKEIELQTDGNIFFAFFVHPVTGHVRVRTIPVDEIAEMITDPGDRKQVWYYKRVWQEVTFDFETGVGQTKERIAYYPDWAYWQKNKRTKIGNHEVINKPVYHVKVGGFSDWKFGVGEVHSALYWAKAYNKFLSNWASLMAVYARFALKITTSGGQAGREKAKTQLGTTMTGSTVVERNPPPATASSFVRSQNAEGVTQADVDVVRTAGATTSAEDGRRLLLMVCAALGIPETFFGDLSTGNHATAKTLDRPTELGFVNRQQLWTFVYHVIIDFVIYCSVKAPDGLINKEQKIGTLAKNEYGEDIIEWSDDVNPHVDIDFPSIVEHDLQTYVAAVKTAATLDGATPSVLSDNRMLARMMLTALGENDIDELLDRLYPLDDEGNPIVTEDETTVDVADELMQVAQSVREAVSVLRESLDELFSNTNTNGNGVNGAH